MEDLPAGPDAAYVGVNRPLLTDFGQLEDSLVNVLDEAGSKALLARNDVPVPAAKIVHSIEAAVATTDALGYPVVGAGAISDDAIQVHHTFAPHVIEGLLCTQ